MDDNKTICSFCGSDTNDGRDMIASPDGSSFICTECIKICKDVVTTLEPISDTIELPTPKEIKKMLDEETESHYAYRNNNLCIPP